MKLIRRSVRWGTLQTIPVPNFIVRDGSLILDAHALAVLIALLHSYKITPKSERTSYEDATIFVRQYPEPGKKLTGRSLMERTGLCRRDLSRGIKQLRERGFLLTITNLKRPERSKAGRLVCQGYVLLDASSGTVLQAGEATNVLFSNKLPYFTFPKCLVTELEKRWSLAALTGPELRLYLVALWLANKNRRNEFSTYAAELRKLSRLSPGPFETTVSRLENLGLLTFDWAVADPRRNVSIEICDPFSGMPLPMMDGIYENDPNNYTTKQGTSRGRRMDFNIDINNPAAVEKFITEGLGYTGPIVHQGNGNLMICCPFHNDSTPSMSICPSKQGCWHCFGCPGTRSGSIFDLVKAFAAVPDSNVEIQRPDSEAEAIYPYWDAAGRLRKEVLRLPGKKFRQRQPDKATWRWDTEGLPPMLYNAYLLKDTGIVAVAEGEKDCDSITQAGVWGLDGWVIGVTSGSADSWHPSLAKQLRGKKVIIAPDDDEAGARYADQAESSLLDEGIEYRRISFQGTGAKDATDFLASHTKDEFVNLLGREWLGLPESPEAPAPTPVPECFIGYPRGSGTVISNLMVTAMCVAKIARPPDAFGKRA